MGRVRIVIDLGAKRFRIHWGVSPQETIRGRCTCHFFSVFPECQIESPKLHSSCLEEKLPCSSNRAFWYWLTYSKKEDCPCREWREESNVRNPRRRGNSTIHGLLGRVVKLQVQGNVVHTVAVVKCQHSGVGGLIRDKWEQLE